MMTFVAICSSYVVSNFVAESLPQLFDVLRKNFKLGHACSTELLGKWKCDLLFVFVGVDLAR